MATDKVQPTNSPDEGAKSHRPAGGTHQGLSGRHSPLPNVRIAGYDLPTTSAKEPDPERGQGDLEPR